MASAATRGCGLRTGCFYRFRDALAWPLSPWRELLGALQEVTRANCVNWTNGDDLIVQLPRAAQMKVMVQLQLEGASTRLAARAMPRVLPAAMRDTVRAAELQLGGTARCLAAFLLLALWPRRPTDEPTLSVRVKELGARQRGEASLATLRA